MPKAINSRGLFTSSILLWPFCLEARTTSGTGTIIAGLLLEFFGHVKAVQFASPCAVQEMFARASQGFK